MTIVNQAEELIDFQAILYFVMFIHDTHLILFFKYVV